MKQYIRLLLAVMLCSIFAGPLLADTEAKPARIASINLCTDQLLLALVKPERIVSITHLATQQEYSYHWQKAQGLHENTGLAEQIIPLNPDLILASAYTPGSAVNLLKRLNLPVEVVDIPLSLTAVESFIRKIGALVKEPERAEQMILRMQQKIARSQAGGFNKQRTAIVYAPNGHTAGSGTLKHEVMQLAGYRNLAAELGIEQYGNLAIEQLLVAQPDLVIIDDSTTNQNSLAQRFTHHPALKKALKDSQFIQIEANQWLCAGPMAADAVEKLVAHARPNQQALAPR